MIDKCKEEEPNLYKQLEIDLQCIRGNQCLRCLQGKECSKERQCAKGDLDREFVRLAIEEGILDMAAQCQKLFPKWESPQANFLKTQLGSIYPEFLETLEERFGVFEKVCLKQDRAALCFEDSDFLADSTREEQNVAEGSPY